MSWNRFRSFICLAAFAVWWGGLTFYSLVVVPIGSELFGTSGQGFVTQQVTNYLNWLSLVALALLLWRLVYTRQRIVMITWLMMVACAAGIFWLHVQLDRMLDPRNQSIVDSERFYDWHRGYLFLTAVQWFAGLICLAWLSGDGSRDDTPQGTRT